MTYVLHFFQWHDAPHEYFPVPGAKLGQPAKLTTVGTYDQSTRIVLVVLLDMPHTVSEEQNAFICILVSLIHLKSVILSYFHLAGKSFASPHWQLALCNVLVVCCLDTGFSV
jgi:hypothetical protein